MSPHSVLRRCVVALLLAAPLSAQTKKLQPIVYTVHVAPPTHQALDIDVQVPTDGRDSIFLMMPIWSPYDCSAYIPGDQIGIIRKMESRPSVGTWTSMSKSRRMDVIPFS